MSKTIKTISAITKNPEYSANAITALMKKLELNERGFAVLMNVTVQTVRDWLYNGVIPCSAARRLMQVLDALPSAASVLSKGG